MVRGNVFERLAQYVSLLASVEDTLTHTDEMAAWEANEYRQVRDGYVSEIETLKAYIHENFELLNN